MKADAEKAIDRLGTIRRLGSRAANVARSVLSFRDDLPMWIDLWTSRRQLRFLRDGLGQGGADGPRVAVFSLSGQVYPVKVEAMLATALRLSGWRATAIVESRDDKFTPRYLQAFGIDDLKYVSDYTLSAGELEECDREAEALSAAPMTFRSVKAWAVGGCWIGPQILSTVSRKRHEGAPDPGDPQVRDEVRALLPLVLRRVLLARKVLKDIAPDLALTIEANYAYYGPFVDAAIERGADVIQATQPWRDDGLMCKRLNAGTRRMHPSSVDGSTFAELCTRPWGDHEEAELQRELRARYDGTWALQSRNQPNTVPKTKAEIVSLLDLDPDKKIAVVFAPVLWDANLFFGEDLFEDFGEWFVETVRAASENPHVNWVIKLHPANVWKRRMEGVDGALSEEILISRHLRPLPGHVTVLAPDSAISTLSLFECADYGVTVRGTSGMELPCFGVATVTAGTGRYSGLGFTIDPADGREYVETLLHIHDVPAMTDDAIMKAKRHAHAVFALRPWRMKSFRGEFAYRHVPPRHRLRHNLRPVVRSIEEIHHNGDLRSWSEWAADPGRPDYLDGGIAPRHGASADGPVPGTEVLLTANRKRT